MVISATKQNNPQLIFVLLNAVCLYLQNILAVKSTGEQQANGIFTQGRNLLFLIKCQIYVRGLPDFLTTIRYRNLGLDVFLTKYLDTLTFLSLLQIWKHTKPESRSQKTKS